MDSKILNVDFDVRSDSNNRDPDGYSLTLNRYHEILWNKNLPNGNLFSVRSSVDKYDQKYILLYKNTMQELILSSDIITTTYTTGWSNKPISEQIIPYIDVEQKRRFDYHAHTIGSFIIFPKRKNNGNSINQNRGVHPKVCDRFDITLECIRRQYIDHKNPLTETLNRYKEYFDLFIDFKGFCEFFLLQDLVINDFNEVKFFLPFQDFNNYPLPKSIIEYNLFMNNSIQFIKYRNERIKKYVQVLTKEVL